MDEASLSRTRVLNLDHAGFRERARRSATSSRSSNPPRGSSPWTHLLEQPDRRDPLARVDVLVPSDLLEDRDPVVAGQLVVRSFFHSDLRGGRCKRRFTRVHPPPVPVSNSAANY